MSSNLQEFDEPPKPEPKSQEKSSGCTPEQMQQLVSTLAVNLVRLPGVVSAEPMEYKGTGTNRVACHGLVLDPDQYEAFENAQRTESGNTGIPEPEMQNVPKNQETTEKMDSEQLEAPIPINPEENVEKQNRKLTMEELRVIFRDSTLNEPGPSRTTPIGNNKAYVLNDFEKLYPSPPDQVEVLSAMLSK